MEIFCASLLPYILLIKEFIIPICAIVTISLYFKNRRNPLREDIFKRQTDLLLSIIVIVEEIDEAFSDYYEGKKNHSGEVENLTDHVCNKCLELDRLLVRGELLLPDKLNLKLHKYLMYVYEIQKKVLYEDYNPSNRELSEKQYDLIEDIRQHIGIEKLSKETFNIIKSRIY